jgi:NADPH2:quinone reductase
MARAVVATTFGGPEALSVVDVPVPKPGAGEVLVAVRAAGANPMDYRSYSGAFGADPSQLPMRLGREASGVVIGLGDPSPSGVRVGDEVMCYPVRGAYSTELVVDGSDIVPKPTGLSFEQAGGLLLAGATAVHTLGPPPSARGTQWWCTVRRGEWARWSFSWPPTPAPG